MLQIIVYDLLKIVVFCQSV